MASIRGLGLLFYILLGIWVQPVSGSPSVPFRPGMKGFQGPTLDDESGVGSPLHDEIARGVNQDPPSTLNWGYMAALNEGRRRVKGPVFTNTATW